MKLNVDKLLGKNEQAEDEMENFENEGGAISSLPEELVKIEKYRKLSALGASAPVQYAHPLSIKFYELLEELKKLHKKKGADYGSLEDPFLNIREGQEFGIEAWKNAISRGNDKMVRIKQYAKTGTLENESVRDSFIDLANYALIALILWEEDERNEVV